MIGLHYWFIWTPGLLNIIDVDGHTPKLANHMVAKLLRLPITDWGIGVTADDPRVAKIFLEGRYRTLYPENEPIEFTSLTHWRVR